MNEKDALQLPFLTRSMLDFGKEAVFELETVAYSNNAGAVRLVGLTKGALIKFDVSHAGDHNEEVKTFRITDIPIMLNVFTDDVTIEVGEWFASVYLKVNGERVMKLMSGYVSKQSGISYPQTHDESEVPGVAAPHGRGGLRFVLFHRPRHYRKRPIRPRVTFAVLPGGVSYALDGQKTRKHGIGR